MDRAGGAGRRRAKVLSIFAKRKWGGGSPQG